MKLRTECELAILVSPESGGTGVVYFRKHENDKFFSVVALESNSIHYTESNDSICNAARDYIRSLGLSVEPNMDC